MVHGVVDAEETVVGAVEYRHGDWAVLGVVLGDVERQLRRYRLCENLCCNILFAFVEKSQHGVINIVIKQGNAFLGRAYEVGNESVGIEDLAVEEDALSRLLASFEQLENAVNALVGGNLVLLEGVNPLEYTSIGYEEVAHSDKGIHNLDAYLDSSIAM